MLISEVTEIRNYIIQKINDTPIYNTPFSHTVIDDFLPKNFYRQLNRYFPEHVDAGFTDSMKKNYRFIKSVFDHETVNSKQEANHIYNIFSQVFDRELADVLLDKFDVSVKEKIAWMCDYCWDLPNNDKQALIPHTDLPSKIISIVVYLPIPEQPLRVVDGQVQYLPVPGTDLLVQDSSNNFLKVKEVKAYNNRATIFRKSDTSWHSVEPTKYPRRTITIFIVAPANFKTNEGIWKYKEI